MTQATYYHFPVWMTILVYSLQRANLVCKLKNKGKSDAGLYQFDASYGKEEGREETLFVWNAAPEVVYKHLRDKLPTDVALLVHMVEEYSRERNGRDEPKVYRGIIELTIARAVELFNANKPHETLSIAGDFSLIGRLPRNGRLLIKGNVSRVETPLGAEFGVMSEDGPVMTFGGMAFRKEGVWRFSPTVPNCVFPPS